MTSDEADPPEMDGEVGVRIKAHPGLCTGFGNCHRWSPQVYPLDADGRIDIHLLDVPPELAAAARIGAQVCPDGVITVIEMPDNP